MDLCDTIEKIQTREGLVNFIDCLRQDLVDNPDEWENTKLNTFLEAMQAWVNDSDGYFKNTGETPPPSAAWKFVADVLYAGKIYE